MTMGPCETVGDARYWWTQEEFLAGKVWRARWDDFLRRFVKPVVRVKMGRAVV